MSNVIAFLEALGREASPIESEVEYIASVEALDVDDQVRHALLARDAGKLGELLGARPRMVCALMPADDDERKDDDGDDDDKDSPDDNRESVSRRAIH
ncbi:MAG: hypothetical protein K0M64_11690 [Rhizobium sp.]|nr:hypothetical protein [Rhizobium sp.]